MAQRACHRHSEPVEISHALPSGSAGSDRSEDLSGGIPAGAGTVTAGGSERWPGRSVGHRDPVKRRAQQLILAGPFVHVGGAHAGGLPSHTMSHGPGCTRWTTSSRSCLPALSATEARTWALPVAPCRSSRSTRTRSTRRPGSLPTMARHSLSTSAARPARTARARRQASGRPPSASMSSVVPRVTSATACPLVAACRSWTKATPPYVAAPTTRRHPATTRRPTRGRPAETCTASATESRLLSSTTGRSQARQKVAAGRNGAAQCGQESTPEGWHPRRPDQPVLRAISASSYQLLRGDPSGRVDEGTASCTAAVAHPPRAARPRAAYPSILHDLKELT